MIIRLHKVLCASLCAALFAGTSRAEIAPPDGFLLDPEVVKASARSVTREKFPDADQVLVDDRVLERYEKDGTSVVWDDEWSLVLTEKGRRNASSSQFRFNVCYGTTFVHRAEIIKPDGQVVAIDAAEYSRVMTETGQMHANIYDPNNKVLTLSLPGVEIGDLCHLVVCRRTFKARVPDTWSDYAVFEYDQPIVRLEYLVSAPAELPVVHRVLRDPVKGTLRESREVCPDGRTLYRWVAEGVPQMFPEPNMPPLYTQVQRVIMSTIKEWRSVSRWYWELCQPALQDTSEEMAEKVRELVKDTITREERIQRIFKFVSQEIRYMGVTPEETAPGYEPHPVTLTFRNRYGVCRDKAALLAAMLRLAEIPAYPVLIHAGARMDPDVPLPYFNHAITAVDREGGGGYILMDPTDENTRELLPAYLCNRSYLVARPEGEELLVSDIYPAEKNLARVFSQGELAADGTLLLRSEVVFEGINDNLYRGYLVRQKSEERRRFFEGVVKRRMPGARVVECAIMPDDLRDTGLPLVVKLTIQVPGYPVRGQGVDQIAAPWLGTVLGYANFLIRETGLSKRRYTMDTGVTCGIDESFSLDLRAAVTSAFRLPGALEIDRGGISCMTRQEFSEGVYSGSSRYLVKTPEFTPAMYLELKQALAEMDEHGRQQPLFLSSGGQQQDTETLSSATETHLASSSEWVTTNTLVKRVLTYAGKKSSSEMKFNFNPAWQDMEIVSATVSNLDSTVHTATELEINVMDAPWCGAAPRYPAAKTLVLSLPGVEIGSVIQLVTRFEQRRGFFYSHAHNFGGNEPVHFESCRIVFPRDLDPRYQLFHGTNIAFTALTNEHRIAWQWSGADLAPVRSEEHLPPWHLFQPTLYISCGDWGGACRRATERA